jgi:glycosyltransferase involved in cell wall biosynthesis
LCQEVVETLKGRGHTVEVLTNGLEAEGAPATERGVHRVLHLESEDLLHYRPTYFFTNRKRHEKQDLAAARRAVGTFQPDLVFVWGMWAMSTTIPSFLEQLDHPQVAYYVADYWPSRPSMHTRYWTLEANHTIMRLPKRALNWLATRMLAAEGKPPKLQFDHVICVSAAVRKNLIEAGLAPFRHAVVIHNGIAVAPFLRAGTREKAPTQSGSLSLLFAGRAVPEKGIHTAIEAMGRLVHEEPLGNLHLTVVAPSGHPDYERHLRAIVADQGLEDCVTFHGAIPRENMPSLLVQFDVLVFPSIYEEPLARMTQEAMLSGLVVVGTTTGGTKEILEHGVNGLTFEPEDARGLARQIGRLAADADLRRQLAEAGRQTVLERFTLTRMVDEIEDYLLRIVSDPQSDGSAR